MRATKVFKLKIRFFSAIWWDLVSVKFEPIRNVIEPNKIRVCLNLLVFFYLVVQFLQDCDLICLIFRGFTPTVIEI